MNLTLRRNLAQRLILMIAATTSAVVSATATAAEHRPPHPPLGIEKALMDAELAQQMAQRTGLAADELVQQFAAQAPHRVALELGLDREQMRALHCAAVQALVQRHQLEAVACSAPQAGGGRPRGRPHSGR